MGGEKGSDSTIWVAVITVIGSIVVAIITLYGRKNINPPASAPIVAPMPAPTPTPVSDLDKCKAGQSDACRDYSNSLASTCSAAGTPPQQLACQRIAQCYKDRAVALAAGNTAVPPQGYCDSQGKAVTVY